ncbi:hypothetical protein HPP92_010394 [Vanilla planifolia]|uniref:Uncharacterized protein n=1 Tax=Vanilla planifolia TaxID=51239 RepID=A0A835R6D5_VANPL|nr:hypothetical protein HPP92_010394 [Vanilla planifolia]
MLLSCILSVVDDTKLLTKIIMRELQPMLKELVLDKYGRRVLLALLHPQCHRYFTPDDLACLNFTMPSLCSQDTEVATEPSSANPLECDKNDNIIDNSKNEGSSKIMNFAVDSKKEPFKEKGISLIATCVDNAGELLRSNFGREVIFEVAVGGSDAILQTLGDRLADLHQTIAAIASLPRSEESEEDHVFEHFHPAEPSEN